MPEGLVYCPLQKKWVEEIPAPAPKPASPLDQICSPSDTKERFFNELLARVSTRFRSFSDAMTVDFYFAFSKQGRDALEAAPKLPDFPESPGEANLAVKVAGYQIRWSDEADAPPVVCEEVARVETLSGNSRIETFHVIGFVSDTQVGSESPRGPPTPRI